MGRKGRELLRGRPLSQDCYRATCSGVEYTENGTDYYGCYGLMDWPDNYNDECRECGAFVDNMPPYAEGGTVSESGVGITYLWTSKTFPPFIRLEGKRGEFEVYVPERTCRIEMYPMGLHEEDGEAPICSACRVAIDEDVYFCPNCGARVEVSE